eukprot:147248_1
MSDKYEQLPKDASSSSVSSDNEHTTTNIPNQQNIPNKQENKAMQINMTQIQKASHAILDRDDVTKNDNSCLSSEESHRKQFDITPSDRFDITPQPKLYIDPKQPHVNSVSPHIPVIQNQHARRSTNLYYDHKDIGQNITLEIDTKQELIHDEKKSPQLNIMNFTISSMPSPTSMKKMPTQYMEAFMHKLQNSEQPQTCPNDHKIKLFTANEEYRCNKCGKYSNTNSNMWACHRCDFYVCKTCCRTEACKQIEKLRPKILKETLQENIKNRQNNRNTILTVFGNDVGVHCDEIALFLSLSGDNMVKYKNKLKVISVDVIDELLASVVEDIKKEHDAYYKSSSIIITADSDEWCAIVISELANILYDKLIENVNNNEIKTLSDFCKSVRVYQFLYQLHNKYVSESEGKISKHNCICGHRLVKIENVFDKCYKRKSNVNLTHKRSRSLSKDTIINRVSPVTKFGRQVGADFDTIAVKIEEMADNGTLMDKWKLYQAKYQQVSRHFGFEMKISDAGSYGEYYLRLQEMDITQLLYGVIQSITGNKGNFKDNQKHRIRDLSKKLYTNLKANNNTHDVLNKEYFVKHIKETTCEYLYQRQQKKLRDMHADKIPENKEVHLKDNEYENRCYLCQCRIIYIYENKKYIDGMELPDFWACRKDDADIFCHNGSKHVQICHLCMLCMDQIDCLAAKSFNDELGNTMCVENKLDSNNGNCKYKIN